MSKGFGFINFKEPESAARCVDTLQGKEYKTKTLYAGRAQKKMERQVGLRNGDVCGGEGIISWAHAGACEHTAYHHSGSGGSMLMFRSWVGLMLDVA